MTTALMWHRDPGIWLDTSGSPQAALVRRHLGRPPASGDDDELQRLTTGLVSYIRSKGTPHHQPFQKSYGEALVRLFPDLRRAFGRIIAEQWKSRGKIGHYELYAGLVMEDQDPEILAPTLAEIHGLLQNWNNEGWCPWTPALWLRILWLGREQLDSSAAITTQLEHIESHLDDDARFQDREPFCLMHAIGCMAHPVAESMRARFCDAFAARQETDGSWGDFSYVAHALIARWGLASPATS